MSDNWPKTSCNKVLKNQTWITFPNCDNIQFIYICIHPGIHWPYGQRPLGTGPAGVIHPWIKQEIKEKRRQLRREFTEKIKVDMCVCMPQMCVLLTVRRGLGQEAVVTSENVKKEKNGLRGRCGAIPQATSALGKPLVSCLPSLPITLYLSLGLGKLSSWIIKHCSFHSSFSLSLSILCLFHSPGAGLYLERLTII